ncbi:MAG: hypothetical protein B7Y89_05165 [Novosphingobium sp. 32-60-15]|nr:MAG: hypothetical protein B7Y89_05165 [Novosphingobium sp. 32-60-15]
MSSHAGIDANRSAEDLNGTEPPDFAREAMKRTFHQFVTLWRILVASVWQGVTHVKQDKNVT